MCLDDVYAALRYAVRQELVPNVMGKPRCGNAVYIQYVPVSFEGTGYGMEVGMIGHCNNPDSTARHINLHVGTSLCVE